MIGCSRFGHYWQPTKGPDGADILRCSFCGHVAAPRHLASETEPAVRHPKPENKDA